MAASKKASALVRAEHGAAPVRLDAKQKTLLGEALRRGEDLREEVETSVTSYGRWLLGEVFADDAAAALDDRTKNPVWIELVRRAGGPTLRIGRRVLYVAVAIAANDKRIANQAWRGLDSARKELLLPLRETSRLRQAAQHVSKFELTQAKTREYVTSLLGEQGRARQVRLTGRGLGLRVKKLRETLDGAATLRKVSELHATLDPKERERVATELDRLKDLLVKLSHALRGRSAAR